MTGVCRGTKRNGEPCTAPATGRNGYCWAHDPTNAEQRKRAASRAGRSRGGGSPGSPAQALADLRARTGVLYREVHAGTVDPKVGAVLSQVANTEARIMELERRWFEVLEVEARLDALEKRLDPRRIS